jgi:hypothetical protein
MILSPGLELLTGRPGGAYGWFLEQGAEIANLEWWRDQRVG